MTDENVHLPSVPPGRLRVLAQLDRHAQDRPDVPAITHAPAGALDRDLTWSHLRHAVERLAGILERNLVAGQVLLLCSPNLAAFTVAFLAGLRAGLRVFPVSPSLTPGELQVAARQASAQALIGTAEAIRAIRQQVERTMQIDEVFVASGDERLPTPATTKNSAVRDCDDTALLLHSSGTTATPKIVVRSGRSVDAVSQAMADAIGFRPDDTVLACVPLCHSYGIEHGLLAPLWAGSTVRLCQGFDLPTVMAELDAGATIFPGVPFIYEMLARQAAGRRYPRLRRAYSAGGPLPDAVRDAVRQQLGVTVTQLYGATEIGSVTYSDPDVPGFSPASVGRAMRGVDIRILPPDARSADVPLDIGAEGQVVVRADSMFDGYLEDAEGEKGRPGDKETSRPGEALMPAGPASPRLPVSPSPRRLPGGYFVTGDLGRLDANGNLTLTGRLKLLIDVAGLKVNPLEVEAALAQHPAVSASVVVEMPVSATVSRLKAIVVRSAAARTDVTGETLRQFLRERLAPYKVPRVYEFRDDLPRSAAGKVLRRDVD